MLKVIIFIILLPVIAFIYGIGLLIFSKKNKKIAIKIVVTAAIFIVILLLIGVVGAIALISTCGKMVH